MYKLPITVVPAYGRDYKTSEEVVKAWMDNKDFCIDAPGYPSYINKQDAEDFGVPKNIIRFRFMRKEELLILKLVDGEWKKKADTTTDLAGEEVI